MNKDVNDWHLKPSDAGAMGGNEWREMTRWNWSIGDDDSDIRGLLKNFISQ